MSFLEKIEKIKKEEVLLFRKTIDNNSDHPIHIILKGQKNTNAFYNALKNSSFAIIAEIKRRSPSKGELAAIEDPVAHALQYEKGGADAISVLTDEEGFSGSVFDLEKIAQVTKLPVLRKDFIIDPYQIAEAKYYGASAVLLIVSLLKSNLKEFIDAADFMGLDALVEVHSEKELQIALDAKAKIIGINNRDLKTLDVDPNLCINMLEKIPNDVITIAESGISQIERVEELSQQGFNGALIGEMLVKAKDPCHMLQEIRRRL